VAFSCTFSERRLDEHRKLNRPWDRIKRTHISVQNHRTVLHKLPHRLILVPFFQKNEKTKTLRIIDQRPTDSAEEAEKHASRAELQSRQHVTTTAACGALTRGLANANLTAG
jgi:hypothetical protein